MIIRFPRHKWHRCESDRCSVCEGRLALCVTCGGAEGSLPTDCPGERLCGQTLDHIQAGVADYRAGEGWVIVKSTGQD